MVTFDNIINDIIEIVNREEPILRELSETELDCIVNQYSEKFYYFMNDGNSKGNRDCFGRCLQ